MGGMAVTAPPEKAEVCRIGYLARSNHLSLYNASLCNAAHVVEAVAEPREKGGPRVALSLRGS